MLACNQSSNRDPIVSYDDRLVEVALSSLKDAGLLRFVHPSHGRSVTRYRQVLDERFGLDARGLALLAVLLLRGSQTVGELRSRTERMADFENLADIEAEIGRLSDGPDPLVQRLHRQPGQKEERWAQRLTGDPADTIPVLGTAAGAPFARVTQVTQGSPSVRDDMASLRADLDALREELGALKGVVDEMKRTSGT